MDVVENCFNPNVKDLNKPDILESYWKASCSSKENSTSKINNTEINGNQKDQNDLQSYDLINDKIDFENEIPMHSINCNQNKNITHQKLQKAKPEQNIPLLIKDILNLNISLDNAFGKNLSVFDIPFETVMIYGNCSPDGKFKNKKKYIVDDGTGFIQVNYTCQQKCSVAVQNLRHELNIYKRNGNSSLYESLNRLLKHVEEETHIPEEHFKNGSRVVVIGVPYINNKTKKIVLHAYEMKLDDSQNREKELFFKRNLIRYYTIHYAKALKLNY